MGSQQEKDIGKIMETVFDTIYLGLALVCGTYMMATAVPGTDRFLFGVMAIVLATGDAFHLVPRVLDKWRVGGRRYSRAMNTGKLITSVTMTGFYVLLWEIGVSHYADGVAQSLSWVVYLLAIVRCVLCLFPQNGWQTDSPAIKWSVIRNVPFVILGGAVAVMYFINGLGAFDGLSLIWLYILISFGFYLPVVLFAQKYPKVGILMLPKTCAYVAIILAGLSL